jgi:excisionase family DNA binding protein
MSLTLWGVFRICAPGGEMLPTRGDKRLTTAEAAKRVGVQPGTIRSWASRGYLTAWGTNERGQKLYIEERVVEVEREVRERGLERMGLDPRRLRNKPRRLYKPRTPRERSAA